MTPATLKTTGYLVSTLSVLLLGVSAWPGAQGAGLIPALLLGMAASIGGMALRWYSYEVEKRTRRAPDERRADSLPPATVPRPRPRSPIVPP